MSRLSIAILLLAPVLLAGCHSRKDARNLDTLDNQLASANAADPALQGALNDQIMVDPALTQQSNGAAIRPPAKPYSGAVPPAGTTAGGKAETGPLRRAPAPGKDCPECRTAKGALTLGELARRQKSPGMGGCSNDVRYGAEWATRLGDLPIYPGAHVAEAAGSNRAGCALRIVSFTTPAPASRVIDYYYTQATKAGYDAGQQSDGRQRVLGGTRNRDGGAYVVFVDPSDGGGSSVDLVVNNGR
ncbi:MAG: hypothetical protein ACTHKR_01470 [Sphingomonas sp.]